MKVLVFLTSVILFSFLWTCSNDVTPVESVSHTQEWIEAGNEKIHADFISAKNWSLDQCKSCHGTDYKGGESEHSCYKCHDKPGGPTACNNCHGNSAASAVNAYSWAPPQDLSGNSSVNFTSVGAHQVHLRDTTWTKVFLNDCTPCHNMPEGFDDPMHIDNDPDDIISFGSIATQSGRLNTTWNRETATCENVYCHGGFQFRKSEAGTNAWIFTESVISGNNPDLNWVSIGTNQAMCGTCHGIPPQGHVDNTQCHNCHGSVVNENNGIMDRSKHMNGQVDLN